MVFYYENILGNENKIAKPNVSWGADITKFKLDEGKIIYVFVCIDLFSNRIIGSVFRTKEMTAFDIVKKLDQVVEQRLTIQPRREIILHTDRGSQFTSETYNKFIKRHEGYIIPSMSRANTPKDNAVVERFIRTFKGHRINGNTFQDELYHQLEISPKFKGYRKIFNLYVKSLNLKPNKKSNEMSPEEYDSKANTASMLMTEPVYSKAFSDYYGPDFRRQHIDEFKQQNNGVIDILDQIAAKQAELVEKTPFDLFEDNLALEVINERIKGLYLLFERNPEITRQYVEETILPIQDMLESMDEKIDLLLPKKKKARDVLPLRDPLYTELFEIFLNAAASSYKYKQDLKCAQLKTAYTILFYVGLRVNEIRFFQEKDIQDAISTSQFSVIHFKQKQPHIHVISDLAVQELKKLKPYYDIIFHKYKFNYLFGKNKPIDEKYLIKMINKDLKHISQINQIPYNIKSHSFRINMISRLLKNTSVHNAADIIGHRDIKSTMAYKRYALNKKEIQDLLNRIDEQD